MTRQHFQVQADLCADIISDLDLGTLDQKTASIINSFCDMCGRNNPAFDGKRFATWVFDKLDEIKNN